jgi:hypothetical protein
MSNPSCISFHTRLVLSYDPTANNLFLGNTKWIRIQPDPFDSLLRTIVWRTIWIAGLF